MRDKYRKTSKPLSEYVRMLYGHTKASRFECRITPELKQHLESSAYEAGISASDVVSALIVKEFGMPTSEKETYMTDEDLEL